MSPEFLLRDAQQLELSTRYNGRIISGGIGAQTPSGTLFGRGGVAFPCLDTTVVSSRLKTWTCRESGKRLQRACDERLRLYRKRYHSAKGVIYT